MKKVRRELLRAIDNGDVAEAERALRRGADPNATDQQGVPPLFHAAQRGNVDMVSCLIRFGADPLQIERVFGRNALGFMIHRRRLDVSAAQLGATARLLIAHGTRPDQPPDPSYVSPWWQAVGDCRCTSVVNAMLESGVDPNRPLAADTNYMPLMEAAVNRHVEAVKALLEAGADPGATTTRGFSAAQLIEAENPDDPAGSNWSLKDTADVLRLLRSGQDPDGEV